MCSFYYRYSMRKAGRWQNELFGKHNVSCSSITIKCLWLQSLLFCIFCLDCTCAPTESPTSDSLFHTESLHARPNFLDLKKIAHAPEMQHSDALIPVWKPLVSKRVLKALKTHSMMEEQALSVSPHKLLKYNRRFKRDLENLSQKSSLSELASTVKEILRKILGQETLSLWPELENNKSIASDNTRRLSSFPGELLRTGLLNDTSLNHVLKIPSSATILLPDLSEMPTPPHKWIPLSEMPTPPHKWTPLSEMPTPPHKWTPLSEMPTPPHKWTPLSEMPTPPHKWTPLSETPTPPHKWTPLSEMPTPPHKWTPLSETPTPPHKWIPLSETPTPPHKWIPLSETPTPPHKWIPLSETPTPPHKWIPLSETPTPPHKWIPLSETPTPPHKWIPLSETPTPPHKWIPLSETPTPPHKWIPLSETPTPPHKWIPLSETPTPPHKWIPLSETPTPPHKRSPQSEMTPPQKLDNVVSQMHTFADTKTSPAVEGQMLSTLKHTMFSRADDMPSSGSLNKQEQTASPDFRSFSVQSESTLPSTAQSFPHGCVAKLMSFTNVPGCLFTDTGSTKVLTENGSYQSATFTLKTSSGYTNNGLKELTKFDEKTEQYSGSHKAVTDRFNLLDTSVHQILETSTISLQNSDLSVTKTFPTDLSLVSSKVSVNTKPYSQNSKPSSTLHVDSPVYTSLYLKRENRLDLASVTVDHSTDQSHMTMQRISSSSVADETPVGTSFTLTNLAVHVEQDPSAQTIPHTSKTDQTSEQDKGLDRQRGSLRTFSVSTWPSQTMNMAEVSHSMSFKTPQTDFNTFSSVTSSPFHVKNKSCLLQIHDPANTQTPETSSETLRLTTVYKSTDYESDATVLSTRNDVTPNDGSTIAESTYTDVHSALGFQSTMTSSFEHDPFNDSMNGNGKTNQSTFNLTSTSSSSTMSSTWVNKPLSTVLSLWKSSTSQQSSSTVLSVQKFQTSQSTLYSTETNRVSLRNEATVGQAPTFHQLPTISTPGGTRASHVPTTISEALQRTISTKSMADLEASSIKTSTYHTSMKNHLFSKIYSTRDPMTTQQTSSSPRQPRAVTTTTANNFNAMTGPLSSVASSTATMKPLVNSAPTSRLALLSQSSKITLPNATSTIQVTPAPKEWIPQTIFSLKPTYSSRQTVSSATAALVVTMPLNFHLTGVSFNEQLTNRTSDEYRTLEKEVKLVMDKIFSAKYQNSYLETEIKSFLRGSVIVESNIVFKNIYTPSVSDIIRTLLTDGTKTNYFGWSINGSTVELNGYTKSNLALETLPISLLVLRAGYIAVSQKNQEKQSFLDNLRKAVFNAVSTSFPITNVSISQIRDVYGDLTVRGNLYLNSTVHTSVQSLMSSLLPLVNRSVDLSSIIVNGISNELKVHSINFRVTNKWFVLNLLDMSSAESQLLSKDLSTVVESALHGGNLLQVIMREFKSGSVVCRGDLVYQLPAPGSREVLRIFLTSLGSDGILGSSMYKVDYKSITIGDSSPGPYNEYIDFPGFGVAIIVMCGLCILIFPIILFVCTRTRMLGRRKKATIQRQQDPDNQSHCFEMDNRAFGAFIEQP